MLKELGPIGREVIGNVLETILNLSLVGGKVNDDSCLDKLKRTRPKLAFFLRGWRFLNTKSFKRLLNSVGGSILSQIKVTEGCPMTNE